MSSPRYYIGDVEHSKSVGEDGKRPAAKSALAENLQNRPAIAGREQDPNGRELVIENNAERPRDGGRPRLAPIFFIGTPDDIPKGDTDVQRNSTIDDTHFRRVGFSGEILKNCSWCKVKLPENADLYIYGYNLGAYCSVDCRRKQMALDGYHIEVATTSDSGDRTEDKRRSWCHLL
ncbi:uncharacterized protein J3R85_001566 [Psidium guajava]|nr:uncharacterized protein J3R85_001566 [Psidium guajava]